jgi:hypothetical protein
MDNEVVTQEVPLEEMTQAEYKKARLEGKSVIEKEPSVEEPAEKEPEEVEQEEETEVEPKPKAKGGGFQKRIEKLTKDKSKAEERAAELERRVKELESKSTVKEEKPAKSATDEPQEADYTDFTKYLKDHVRWEVRQELKEQKEQEDIRNTQEMINGINEAHLARIEVAKLEHEDFEDTVNSVNMPWNLDSPTIIEREATASFFKAVKEDENSAEIVYYYATHPEELEKLGELTPGQIGKAVGRVSDKLTPKEKEPPKPKLVSKAPAPIKPVSGGATKNSTPLDQVDMAEYKKRRAAGERG